MKIGSAWPDRAYVPYTNGIFISPVVDSVGNGLVTDAPVPRFRKFSRDVLLHIQRQYSGKTVSAEKRGSRFPASTATVS